MIKAQYPRSIRWVVRHFPLEYHRLAYQAAKAAECAARQGGFHDMYELLFEKQDSIGIKSFDSFAIEIGIADLPLFIRCLSTDDVESNIEDDIRAAETAGALGTPTVIVNGLRLGGTPDASGLQRLVEEELERSRATDSGARTSDTGTTTGPGG